jgi:hypothetical protein
MQNQNPQPPGTWRDDKLLVEPESLAPPHQGHYTIEMANDAGDLSNLDGTAATPLPRPPIRPAPPSTRPTAHPSRNLAA